MKWLVLAAYLATVPLANWMIDHVGTECIPQGPCLIPVGFGMMAPSGVLVVGLALVLRDAVQSLLGLRWALAAIIAGIMLSAAVAPPALVVASALAFGLAEIADTAIYSPLRRRSLALAVLASGIVGAAIDSAVFLYVAFGNLQFIEGQIFGKIVASAAAAATVWAVRR